MFYSESGLKALGGPAGRPATGPGGGETAGAWIHAQPPGPRVTGRWTRTYARVQNRLHDQKGIP